MLMPKPAQAPDRRQSLRRRIDRLGKIHIGGGALPRDCLITDISEGGVRLHVEHSDVPDEFVLVLSGTDVVAKERVYRVVWRLGYEIGARFVRNVTRPGVG